MRTENAPPLSRTEFEALLDDAIEGILTDDAGTSEELDEILGRLAAADPARHAPIVEEARIMFVAQSRHDGSSIRPN